MSTTAAPPTVSFVVIAYNEEANIADCLESLRTQAAGCDAEFIVVDDASTDATRAVARDFAGREPRARLVEMPVNGGRGAARRAGVEASRGDYVAFVDADIVLPPHWLGTTLACLGDGADACGGVAVPDGDVTFLANRFRLRPRPVAPTAAVTGNNGLFRRSVFERVQFAARKRSGEDVDIVHRMGAAGMRATTLPDLLVDHREAKGFVRSVRWLFESGVGASAQLREQRRLRTPDVAFAGAVAAVLAAAGLAVTGRVPARTAPVLPLAYVAVTAGAHLWTRFDVRATPARSAAAWACNGALIAGYYAGRLRGLAGTGGGR
jgi:hypothetical protein